MISVKFSTIKCEEVKDKNDFEIVRKVSVEDMLYRETIEEENVFN